jgi:hypothetical protein
MNYDIAERLASEFDSSAEVRIEVGGPKKHKVLSDEEITVVVAALKGLAASLDWLEEIAE